MDLDNTEIIIRERTLSQRIDLTFHLIRRFASQILLYSAVGIAPYFLLNILLVEGLDPSGYWEYYQWYGKWYLILILTILESPFAMSPLLIFLSQRIFRQKVRVIDTLRRAAAGWVRQFYVYFLVRLNIIAVLILFSSYYTNSGEPFVAFCFATLFWNALFYGVRPYVDAVILLEELRFRSRDGEPGLGMRSSSLHRYQSSDLISESFSLLGINIVLLVGIYAVQLWFVYLILQNTVTLNWFSWTFFALSLWCTQVFSTVFRFLGYLDVRVRLEGWELELRLKSQGNRIRREMEVETSVIDHSGSTATPVAIPTATTAEGS